MCFKLNAFKLLKRIITDGISFHLKIEAFYILNKTNITDNLEKIIKA